MLYKFYIYDICTLYRCVYIHSYMGTQLYIGFQFVMYKIEGTFIFIVV